MLQEADVSASSAPQAGARGPMITCGRRLHLAASGTPAPARLVHARRLPARPAMATVPARQRTATAGRLSLSSRSLLLRLPQTVATAITVAGMARPITAAGMARPQAPTTLQRQMLMAGARRAAPSQLPPCWHPPTSQSPPTTRQRQPLPHSPRSSTCRPTWWRSRLPAAPHPSQPLPPTHRRRLHCLRLLLSTIRAGPPHPLCHLLHLHMRHLRPSQLQPTARQHRRRHRCRTRLAAGLPPSTQLLRRQLSRRAPSTARTCPTRTRLRRKWWGTSCLPCASRKPKPEAASGGWARGERQLGGRCGPPPALCNWNQQHHSLVCIACSACGT